MNPAKIIYIDGRGVSITKHTLKVKEDSFPVKTLSYRPVVVVPDRTPAGLIFLAGFALIIFGFIKISASGMMISETKSLAPAFFLFLGFIVLLGSLIAGFMSRERYAIQITTSSGVKNIVTHRTKEYITKIIHRLNTAVTENHEYYREIQQVA